MGQSDSISTTPPETGSDVNVTVNNEAPDAPAEETETPSTESNDSGDSGDTSGSDSEDTTKSE